MKKMKLSGKLMELDYSILFYDKRQGLYGFLLKLIKIHVAALFTYL